MRTASRLANHSGLWLATATVLGLTGGSRGRRAAVRGVVGISLTSAIVNGPLKLLMRRTRPAEVLFGRPSLVVMPTSSSFPSGHAASAFAFATGVAREWPAVGVPLAAAASTVAYSRVHNGVHYVSDVLVGAGLGVGAAALAGTVLHEDKRLTLPPPEPTAVPRKVVLLGNPDSGRTDALVDARAELVRSGFQIVTEVSVDDSGRLRDLVESASDTLLVIAAGGDGTIRAAADALVGTDSIIGILPLGTSNDVARSLGISADPVRAVGELADGVVRTIDVGQMSAGEGRVEYFVHAATVGFNVHFAQLATSSTVRRRFGRLTYAVAGIRALRQHEPFDCDLEYEDKTERLRLVQLSVINAPVFGGALDLRFPGARMDDRRLLIIAVEENSAVRVLLGGLLAVAGRRGEGFGVRALRTSTLRVAATKPLDVALDGEITSSLPAQFEVAVQGLRVVTPRSPEGA
jgi:undecaprenyl-diphosphatase